MHSWQTLETVMRFKHQERLSRAERTGAAAGSRSGLLTALRDRVAASWRETATANSADRGTAGRECCPQPAVVG